MSDAYERERQNDSRLSELSAKVSALRGVTVDIYDNARAQDVIDNTVRTFQWQRIQDLWLLMRNIVGYVLLDEYIFEGICKPNGADGSVREQGGCLEAFGNFGWSCIGVVVYIPLVLLNALDGFMARFRRAVPNAGVGNAKGRGSVLYSVYISASHGVTDRRESIEALLDYTLDRIFLNTYGSLIPASGASRSIPHLLSIYLDNFHTLIYSQTFENKSSLAAKLVAGLGGPLLAGATGAALLHPPKSSSALTFGGPLFTGANPPLVPGTML